MGYGVKHKVTRYVPPSPKKLVKTVYERCTKNAASYMRRHPGSVVIVESLRPALSTGPGFSEQYNFVITGHTASDARAFRQDWIKRFGDEDGFGGVERALRYGLLRQGHTWSGGREYGPMNFGWSVSIRMTTVDANNDPMFDVVVRGDAEAPRDILRCVEATYNDLVDEYDLDEG